MNFCRNRFLNISLPSITDQISVVAHSQGTIIILIQLSLMPDFEANYNLIFLAAPIGYLADIKGTFALLPRLEILADLFGAPRAAFPPGLAYINAFGGLFCQNPLNQLICLQIFDSVIGFDYKQINLSRLPVYISSIEQTSFKNFGHFAQSVIKDHISYFDHGEDENLALYGSREPPKFPFHRIKTKKLILISSRGDFLATQKSVDKLRHSLNGKLNPNQKKPISTFNSIPGTSFIDHIISYDNWTHLSYLYSTEGYQYFGKSIYEITQKYFKNGPKNG